MVSFTVTLSHGSEKSVTVDAATTGGLRVSGEWVCAAHS